MVTAVRGNKRVRVTRNAYETMFKDAGYVLEGVENPKTPFVEEENETEENEVETENKEEEELEILETTPISEMNKKQLMDFAKLKGINIQGVKNAGEARRRIQKALKEQED